MRSESNVCGRTNVPDEKNDALLGKTPVLGIGREEFRARLSKAATLLQVAHKDFTKCFIHRYNPVFAAFPLANKDAPILKVHIGQFEVYSFLPAKPYEYECGEQRMIPESQIGMAIGVVVDHL